jgi:hypothetical protein
MCHTNNNIIRLELGGEVLSEPVHVWKPANQFWFGRALVEELFHIFILLIVFRMNPDLSQFPQNYAIDFLLGSGRMWSVD